MSGSHRPTRRGLAAESESGEHGVALDSPGDRSASQEVDALGGDRALVRLEVWESRVALVLVENRECADDVLQVRRVCIQLDVWENQPADVEPLWAPQRRIEALQHGWYRARVV